MPWKSPAAQGDPGPLFNKVNQILRQGPNDTEPTLIHQAAYHQETGRLIATFDGEGNETLYAWVMRNGLTIDGSSGSPRSQEDNTWKFQPPQILTTIDANGGHWTTDFDEAGNITRISTPSGVTRSMSYDARNRLIEIKNSAGAVIQSLTWNNHDRILTATDALNHTTTFAYDDFYGSSLLTKVTTPENRVTEYTYDALGNRIKTTIPGGAEWTYEYNNLNRLTKIIDPLTWQTLFEYDARANVSKVTDAMSREVELVYNDFDQVQQLTDALNHVSSYEFDGDGALTKLTDNRSKDYTFNYAANGSRESMTQPDSSQEKFTYDAADNVIQYQPKGLVASADFTYDDTNRVDTINWDNGLGLTGSTDYVRDQDGRVTGVTLVQPDGTTWSQAYSYDGEGRITSHTQQGRTAAFEYDAAGQLTKLTYPTGMVVEYLRNADGQLTAVKKDGSTIASYTYDSAGRRISRALSNGLTTHYEYTVRNELEKIRLSDGTSDLWRNDYGYNGVGNRVWTRYGGSGANGDVYLEPVRKTG